MDPINTYTSSARDNQARASPMPVTIQVGQSGKPVLFKHGNYVYFSDLLLSLKTMGSSSGKL